MSKHTPGPWLVASRSYTHGHTGASGIHFWVVDSQGNALPCDTRSSKNAEPYANAKIIAAAPDMLDALKIARDAMARMDCGSGTRMGDALEQVEKAIAKAEGGAA